MASQRNPENTNNTDENNSRIEANVFFIKDSLEKFSTELDVECLQEKFINTLEMCEPDTIEQRVFSIVLPALHFRLTEVIKEMSDITKSSTSKSINDNLSACERLFGFWQKCLEHVGNLRKISVTRVKSLHDILPETVHRVFTFCKISSTDHANFWDDICERLTSLFRTAYTILKLFRSTLEDVIVFDTDVESETNLLAKVIEQFGILALAVEGMHLRTFQETLLAFGRMALNYRECIMRVSPSSVTENIRSMSKYAYNELSKVQNTSEQFEERNVKCVGFVLKTLEKLVAAYREHLTDEILFFLVELLVNIYSCSPWCLRGQKIEKQIVETLNSRILQEAGPLLNASLKSKRFEQAYFKYGKRNNTNKLAYHILTLSIMKQIDYCRDWKSESNSIFDVAFANIDQLNEELCSENIQFKYDFNEKQESIYEATLMLLCSWTSMTLSSEFYSIELSLLKHLLNGQLWSSLLAIDVWYFLAQIGSTDLCASHVKYLMKVQGMLRKRANSIEVIMLNNLIARLYALLPDEIKNTLVINHCNKNYNVHDWISISRYLSAETKSFLHECISSENISESFTSLQQRVTVDDWLRFVTLISATGKFRCAVTNESMKIFLLIWTSINDIIEDCNTRQLNILTQLIEALLENMQPTRVEENSLYLMLRAAITTSLFVKPRTRIEFSYYLKENANHSSPKLITIFAELNSRLLKDENSWVFQEALESFNYLANACSNENLVRTMAASVTKDSSISEPIVAYLSGESYYEPRNFSSVTSYIHHLYSKISKEMHVCVKYHDSERNGKIPKTVESVEEINSSEEIDECIDRICDELNNILERKSNINYRARRKLKLVLEKILDTSAVSME